MAFYLPQVHIIGTHYCGKEIRKAFKCRSKKHDVLCWRDYAERIVSSFLIKYNLHTMVAMGLYQLKEFY